MSIRLRLTLIYTAILALALLGFSVLSYLSVANDGLAVQGNTLAIKAKRITTSPDFALGNIDAPAALIAGPEVYVQARTSTGEIADRTANLGERQLPLAQDLPTLHATEPWREIAEVEGERLLLYNLPIVVHGEMAGVLQIASSLVEREASLARFRRTLIIGDLLIVLVALVIGWAVAGLGLRPIQRMTETARQIGARRDFGQRVTHADAKDEVGQLAVTFNQMLSALQDAHQQTEESLKAQQRFVADASHELRTPLTTLRGNIGLLHRLPPIRDEDRQSVVQDIAQETDRLMRMVNDLLVLARSDGGHTLQREAVEIKPLIEEVLRQTKLLAPERTLSATSLQAITAWGNRDALRQVLVSLVDNAIKHTPSAATINIITKIEDKTVNISVHDTGPGIAPEQLPHLFERFYQVDSARNGNGAGLGLAIAKTLVEAQGGELCVVSKTGIGSTFTVRLAQSHE